MNVQSYAYINFTCVVPYLGLNGYPVPFPLVGKPSEVGLDIVYHRVLLTTPYSYISAQQWSSRTVSLRREAFRGRSGDAFHLYSYSIHFFQLFIILFRSVLRDSGSMRHSFTVPCARYSTFIILFIHQLIRCLCSQMTVPLGTRGFKRLGPTYPQARRYNDNPCRCSDRHVKEPCDV